MRQVAKELYLGGIREDRHATPVKDAMSKSILIIEDDEYFSSIMKIHLEKQRWNVHIAPTAEAGLEEMGKNPPALVLMDVMLPGMDGFDACLKIKTDPQLKQIPVIMLTGKSKIKHVDHAFEVGADDFVIKSSSLDKLLVELTHKIDKVLNIPT
ncbi:MAG: response regulator [Candidatus Marinimicrobia bacterium]|nr:response regulator [Candidatus Neomarinimicrobiota bacterium]